MALTDVYKRRGGANRGAVLVQEPLNQSVGTGVTATVDLDTTGFELLTVIWRLLASAVAADLNTPAVVAYAPDQVTAIPVALVAIRSIAPTTGGSDIISWAQYDVRGFGKVRIQATNNNVGSKTLVFDTYLGSSK